MTSISNHSYYIPISLAIKATKIEFSDISNTKVKAKESKKVEVIISNKISNDKNTRNIDCSNNSLFDSKLSSDNKYSSDNNTLSESKLSSRELSSDSQNSLDSNYSDNKLLLGYDSSSEGKISSSKELILDEYNLVLTNEDEEDNEIYRGNKDYKDNEVYRDKEDYEAYEEKEYKEYRGYKEYKEYEY